MKDTTRRMIYTIPSKIVTRKIPIRKLFLFCFSIKIKTKYEKLIRSIIQIFHISYNNRLNNLSLTIIIQVNRQSVYNFKFSMNNPTIFPYSFNIETRSSILENLFVPLIDFQFFFEIKSVKKKKRNLIFYRDFGALAHLLKSSLGTGILAMPNAIKNGGVIFGGIGTIIIGLICAHCVHILVRSSHILCKRTKTPQMTYAETAEAAFLCGPKTVRPFANFSRMFVNAALCATYIGGACVYVVFVSTSIKQVSHRPR